MTAVSDADSLCSISYRRGWGKIITWAQEPGIMHSSGDIRFRPNLGTKSNNNAQNGRKFVLGILKMKANIGIIC